MTATARLLYVSWYNPENSFIYPVARLMERQVSPRFRFAYIKGAEAALARGFTPFSDFPDIQALYEDDALFPLFANRLVLSARSDPSEAASPLDLSPSSPDPLLVLAHGPGRRATEKLELFGLPERNPESGDLLYRFLVRGIRHVAHGEEAVTGLAPGQRLLCLLDFQNPIDPFAVVLRTVNPHQMVGFLPHYLGEEAARLRDAGAALTVRVERVNPSPAPRHQRLLCVLTAGGLSAFTPFASPRYLPINPAADA